VRHRNYPLTYLIGQPPPQVICHPNMEYLLFEAYVTLHYE